MQTETVLAKAERLHLTEAVHKVGDVFTVRGDHGLYQISILGDPACTCPASTLGHRTCSHVEAVWLEIRYGSLRRAMAKATKRSQIYDDNHRRTPNGTN